MLRRWEYTVCGYIHEGEEHPLVFNKSQGYVRLTCSNTYGETLTVETGWGFILL